MISGIMSASTSIGAFFCFFIAYALALVIAFCIHEFAHAFAAVKQGDPTPKVLGRLTLNPVKHIDPLGIVLLLIFGFGYARPVPVNPYNFKNGKRSDVIVSLAGILANFLIAFVAIIIYTCIAVFAPSLFQMTSFFPSLLLNFLFYLIYINLLLMIFNLLPIAPLDGFRVVKLCTKPGNKFVYWMENNSFIVMISLFIGISLLSIFGLNPISILADYIYTGLTKLFVMFWRLFI